MVRMEKASGVPPNVCVGVLVRPGVCGGGGKVLVWMTGWGKKHVLVRAPRPKESADAHPGLLWVQPAAALWAISSRETQLQSVPPELRS